MRIAGIVCSCSLLVFVAHVQAQSREDAAIKVGETSFVPSLRVDVGQTDNALRRETDELDDTFTIVRPELVWSADKGLTLLRARYVGAYGISEVSELDYDDHALEGSLQTEFSRRSRIRGTARFSLGHFPLGRDVFSRFDLSGFDQVEFSSQVLSIEHTYGTSQARGQVSTRLLLDNLDFTNNEQVVENSSRFIVQPSVAFSYRLSGDTRSFVSLALSEVDRAANGIDRTDVDLSVGATWDITGRTGGSASVGVGRSSTDVDADRTELTLNIGLFYNPRPFSRFDLEIERGFFNDGSGTLTETAIVNNLDLAWRYDWSSRLFHVASLDLQAVERSCPEIDDQTAQFSFELGLQVRRWLAFGLGARVEQRTNGSCPGPADFEAPDFDRQEAFLFTRVSL